ncbi:MAG: MFS transporter [Alistipes sp.]
MNNKENWKKVFAIIWAGQSISILSSALVGYAVIFWLSIETGSAETLAFAAIAGMLPQSVMGLFVGVYIDRWDRKRTMIFADIFIALCTLVLALLFWLDMAELWHVYVLLACRSAGSAFHNPAMQASVPLLAPESQFTRIAGINQVLQSFSCIAGPALGALLLALTDIGNILLFDVAGAAFACITLFFVHIPNPTRPNTRIPSLWRELREGAAAILHVRGMGSMFTTAILVLLFVMPVGVLFPLMTLEHFSGGIYEMSLIETVWGGGALMGGVVMGLRPYRINKVLLINLMYLLVGITFVLSGLLSTNQFVLFALLTTAAGVSSSIFTASFISVVQQRIAPEVLGRVLSLYSGLSLMPAMLGLLGTGFLAEKMGLIPTFIVAGVAIILIGTWCLFSRSMRALGVNP